MSQRTWFITGVSSGFGRQLADQLLERGECVIGTVRDTGKIGDLSERLPETFTPRCSTSPILLRSAESSSVPSGISTALMLLSATPATELFGAAEELSDEQIDHMIATNLAGSITAHPCLTFSVVNLGTRT